MLKTCLQLQNQNIVNRQSQTLFEENFFFHIAVEQQCLNCGNVKKLSEDVGLMLGINIAERHEP